MGAKTKSIMGTLPPTIQRNLVDCISPDDIDATRYHALVSEHTVGLSDRQQDRLLKEVLRQYERQRDE